MTGAAGGIGGAVAQAFADAGAEVVGLDREQADLTVAAEVESFFAQLERVDVLVNGAGGGVGVDVAGGDGRDPKPLRKAGEPAIQRSVVARERALLDEVEAEPSAAPFHDWNERILAECYRANAFARVYDWACRRVGGVLLFALVILVSFLLGGPQGPPSLR